MNIDCLSELDPALQDIVVKGVQFRLRAIEGVLTFLKPRLERREIEPNESLVSVTYVTDSFMVLNYEGGFFWASFLYQEDENGQYVTVLDAEHVLPRVTGLVVIPDRQFIQRRES